MTILSIDIETFSDVSLRDCGVYKYADSPSFRILLFAYAIDDKPVKLIDLTKENIPAPIVSMIFNPEVTKAAFNAQFERVCLQAHFGQALDPTGWECTMVKAHTLGFAGGLDQVSKLLGFEEDKQKLFTGKNLIRLFSVPRKPTMANHLKTVFGPEDKPDEWQQFKDYCIQDVVVEREIRNALCRYTTRLDEKRLYALDQIVNDRGVLIDLPFVENAMKIDEDYSYGLQWRFKAITGLDNPKAVGELKMWLSTRIGETVDSLTKGTLPELIEKANGQEDVIEVLRIRQEVGKTSVSKYKKMADVVCADGRARGLLQFYGANRTGRWAGRLIQVQNLPQNHIEDLDLARSLVATGDGEMIDTVYGNTPGILSQLIRTAIVAPKGKRFIVADFSAIEARVIAWLAGEKWRLDVFATHGKIYEASASQMFKVPIDSIDKGSPLRQKGKVAELALGYQGSIGALRTMDKKWAANATEEELKALVNQWREANLNIVQFWWDCENAAKEALENKTTVKLQHGISFIHNPGVLFIQLPSGRRIAYRDPKLVKESGFNKIKYMGQNQTTNKWEQLETYGGKLVENIVQATARDCLGYAMLNLHEWGYDIVMHVHDEVVIEIGENESSVDDVCEIMGQSIDWAKGLLLRADGYACQYYKKD